MMMRIFTASEVARMRLCVRSTFGDPYCDRTAPSLILHEYIATTAYRYLIAIVYIYYVYCTAY